MTTILLHGALGSTAQFSALLDQKPEGREVFALNFPGHGGVPADVPFSMPLFADAVLGFMDAHGLAQADIFGYSMGGYVALWLAWKHPERIRRVRTLGTKLNWTEEVAAGMNRMFDPEKIEAKVPQLAEALERAHAPGDWKILCHRTVAFLKDLGNGLGLPSHAFSEIQCPVTIGWGDQDQVVSEEESRQAADQIPHAQFVILPGAKHGIEQVETGQLCTYVF